MFRKLINLSVIIKALTILVQWRGSFDDEQVNSYSAKASLLIENANELYEQLSGFLNQSQQVSLTSLDLLK